MVVGYDERTDSSKNSRGGKELVNEAERIRMIDELQYELFDLEERRLYLLGQMQLFKNTGTKVCRKCNQERSITLFYTDTRYKDDHFPYCKYCKNEDVKARNKRKAA